MSKVSLAISFDSLTGEVRVDGPIHDKIFCFGVLKIAEMIVQNYKQDNAESPRLVVPEMQFKG